jgi:capsular polysaccharide transport system permease protein
MAETDTPVRPRQARAPGSLARMVWRNFTIQRRVVGALIMREIYTRFGRQNLGFGWIIAEPLVFAIPVLLVWHTIRAPFEKGLPLIPFLWSGYLPLMLFRHLGSGMLRFVRANAGLLYHRRVTIFDLFLGRALLEILSNFYAVLVSGLLFILLGWMRLPLDLPMFYLGYFYMTWWSVSVALIIGGLSERSHLVEKIWAPTSYLYMAVSGFFFLSDWLPPHLRAFALKAMPSIQCYDMIRAGMFGGVVHPHYSLIYMIRETRKYLELE